MRPLSASLVKFMRSVYPYGVYGLADGSELLFTRNYKPFVMRDPSKQTITPHDGSWVPNVSWQGWFFDDLSAPWNGFGGAKESALRCQTALHRFLTGAPVDDLFVVMQGPNENGVTPQQHNCYPDPILKVERRKTYA
jgi:hypothetical protein